VSPTVSVVIPAYNAALYLRQALDSVLAQTIRDIEVVVVDDGSNDETPRILAEYAPSVRTIRQENAGVATARNRGIAASSGRYVAFLDADDAWRPNKLERQLLVLANEGGPRAAYTAIAVVDGGLGPTAYPWRPGRRARPEDLLLEGNVIGGPSTVLCERSLLQEAGGFDPTFSLCADWELWIRLSAIADFAYLDEPLTLYRRHPGNMSRTVSVLEEESVRLLRKAYAQPRLSKRLLEQKGQVFGHNYMVLAGSYHRTGAYASALRCGAIALKQDWRQGRRLFGWPWRAVRRVFAGGSAGDF
jgi:glycosyltransferase involved in cell wall biosynthesis